MAIFTTVAASTVTRTAAVVHAQIAVLYVTAAESSIAVGLEPARAAIGLPVVAGGSWSVVPRHGEVR